MMKQSNELYLLIKSMNRNEKGYFKKFSAINSKKGEGNYLRLFDCIDDMEEYNEDVIRKKFKGEKFITQLNVTKLYLQKMIIKSLRNYYSDNDPDIERLNALIESTMLFKKQLFDSALRLLEKTKQSALDYEMPLHYMHASQTEYQIYLRKGMYKEILETSEQRYKQDQKLLADYANLSEYRRLQGIVMSTVQIEGHTRNESVEKIKEIMKDPLLKNINMAKTFKAKMHFYEILFKCYLKISETKKAHQTAKDMVVMFRNHPEKIKQLPYNYFVSLNGLTNRCIGYLAYDEALGYIADSEVLVNDEDTDLSVSQRYEIQTQILEKRIVVYSKIEAFEKGIEVEKKFNAFIKGKGIRTELEVVVLYFSSICHLGAGHHTEALERINKLIHGNYANIRKDLILGAHWLNFIVHFDLGNYSLMKRLFTMAKNFIVKNNFPFADTDTFLKLLTDLVKAAKAQDDALLKAKIAELLPRLAEFDFIDEEVFDWWLKDKI
jgi:hypothetical protein